MNYYREAAALLPASFCGELLVMPDEIQNSAEEIRLRSGRPLTLLCEGRELAVSKDHRVCCDDLYSVLERATFASAHSVENELCRGFITVGSGIRIGICGAAVCSSGRICGLKDFSSMAIRIPREAHGCAKAVFREINSEKITSTLIVAPPGFGKTTFLRDYIRCLSESGARVSVVDERCELAAVLEGAACYDLGPCTDVISGAAKADAAMMLLKAMNPQVIAMDEVSELEDVKAVSAAAGCGIKLLASAHGSSTEDLRRRPVYRDLLKLGVFDYAVIIKLEGTNRKYIIEELLC